MDELLSFLQANSINYQLEQHEEVFTVEAMMKQEARIETCFCEKSLTVS